MSFHHPHELYDANMQQQQQRVKVVAGYALQQRLGSGSFATVYKGIRISAAAPTEQQQQQQQQQQRESSSTSMCDDDENDTTTTAATDVAEDNQQQQQQQQDDNERPAEVAIKAISRTSEKLTKKVLQNLEIEISILRTYRHPNIVCMHDVQKTQQHFYLILEYCDGGDVQHLIRSRQSGRLSEKLTRRLMRDLSSGLRFLWGQELIHRDIKPQNLLLTGRLPIEEIVDNPPSTATIQKDNNNPPNNNYNYGFSLKIADFGFARHLQTASLAETLCGSPLYMAPEILQHHR
jgi:serine/threonine protein kinase